MPPRRKPTTTTPAAGLNCTSRMRPVSYTHLFKLMALQRGSKTLQSGPIAGSGSVARGQELLVGSLRKGNSRVQEEVDEDDKDGAAELHDKLGFLKKLRFSIPHDCRIDACNHCRKPR